MTKEESDKILCFFNNRLSEYDRKVMLLAKSSNYEKLSFHAGKSVALHEMVFWLNGILSNMETE